MKNTITAITGRRGSGKSLLLTSIMKWHYDHGYRVFTNMKGVKFPTTYITLKEAAELPDELHHAVLALDEMQVGADAREIFKAGNKGINKLATQLRKREIAFYFTTQVFKYVDKRLRGQVDEQIHCNKTNVDGIVRLEYYDRTLPLQIMVQEAKILHRKDLRAFFDLYDTNEIIDYDDDF